MRVLIILLLVLNISHSITVLKSDQCSECSGFQNKDDCINANCIWNTNKVCENNASDSDNIDPNEILTYCQSVTIPQQNCYKTRGCAYYNQSCTFFTGCQSYNYNTTVDCQTISSLCISEGDGCIDAKNCLSYKSEDICKNTPSNSGSGVCVWDLTNGICRDQQCSEASTSLQTDQDCSNFILGCVTTGMGCTTTLKSCNTYSNKGIDCKKLIGSDGQCENNDGQQFCQLKQCITAPIYLNQDEQCNKYLQGCVTTGRGCIQILQQCNTYKDNCNEYIGTDGICELDEQTNKCRSRICENGQYQTNEDCIQYKKGCLTNGQKCVTTLLPCSSYKGTIKSCLGLIGNDGQCKGINETEQSCQIKDCILDSNNKFITDDQCKQIKKQCITNGYGCVYQLKLCSEYQYESNICNQMIGSDGKCQGSQNNIGYCESKKCIDAPTTYSTDYECKSFQNNCVSTGKGCIEQNTCENTSIEISCLGTEGCQWNSFCLDSSSCSNYKTQILCQNNNAIQYTNNNGIIDFLQIKCIWKNNQCNNLNCSDLKDPKYDSDAACQQVQQNCVFSGNGCVDKNSDCTQFFGNQQMCSQYANKCWNDSNSTINSQCRSRICSDNTTFQTDEECQYFQKGCRTKGNGCIDETKICSDYQGTQQQCNKFTGYITNSTNRQQCYNVLNAISSTFCIVKTCAMATGVLNDSDCQKFLQGCVWNGLNSCLVETSNCTAFYGTQSQCNTLKGNKSISIVNGNSIIQYDQCYGLITNTNNSHCKKKECTDNQISGLTDLQCNQFLDGCITNLVGCTSKETPCSQFNGTSDTCSLFIGNGKKCTRMSDCSSRQCSDITNPTSHDDCYYYHSKCRFKNITSSCINETNCSNYQAIGNDSSQKYSYCRALKDINQLYCSFIIGDTNCSDYTCDQITISQDCINYQYYYNNKIRKCYYINNQCVSSDDCTILTIDNTSSLKPTTDTTKFTWCNTYYDKNEKQCSYHNSLSTTKCSNFILCEQIQTATSSIDCNIKFSSNPLSITKGCQYYNNKCYSVKTLCSDYVAIGINNTEKTSFCQSMKLNTSLGNATSTTVINCTFISGQSNCTAQTCENITSAINQNDCNKQALNCVYFNGLCFTKQNSCNSYSTVSVSTIAALYCSNMYNSSNENCGYVNGMNYCVNSSSDCKNFRWVAYNGNPAPSPVPSTDADKRQYCQQRKSIDGRLCGYKYGSSYCSIEINYCELIITPTSQLDCDLQAIGCTFIQSLSKCNVTSRIISCNDITFNNSLSTDNDKLLYCKSVQNYNGYCTWITSSNNCDNIPTNCTSISISSLSTDNDKIQFCINRKSTSNQCGWKIGDTISTCRNFNCFDIQNVKSQQTCDSIMTGCTYYRQQCITTQTACNLYYTYGINDEQKYYYCNGLIESTNNLNCTFIKGSSMCSAKQSSCTTYSVNSLSNSDKLIWCYLLKDTSENQCAYSTGDTTCKQIICELILNPTSQKSCDFYLNGCQYYSNKCYTQPTNCTSLLIPSTITNQVEFCTNMKNISSQYCNYVSGSYCTTTSSNCQSITAVGSTTANKQSYCQARKNIDGKICTYSTSYSYCIQADDSVSCTLITGTINSQEYCQKYSINCSYLDQNQSCQLTTTLNNCQTYIFNSATTEDNKLYYCTSILQNTCTYIFGQNYCSDYYSFCTQWDLSLVNDKKTYCLARNSRQGNCAYDELNTSTCILLKCSDIESPTSQYDCDHKLIGCYYYRSSCISYQDNCNKYNTIGSTDDNKLNYCLGLSTIDNIPCTYISGSISCQNIQQNCNLYDVNLITTQTDKEIQCQKLQQLDEQYCIYKSGVNTCSLPLYTCESIINPSNQNDCDTKLNGLCIYYQQQCITIQNICTSIIIPSNISDKYLFCKNMKDTSNNYCTFNSTLNTCDLPTLYCNNIIATGNTDIDKKQYCRQFKSQDGQMCGYNQGINCELERYYCNMFSNSLANQEYCDQRMINCIYYQVDNKCIEKYEIQNCVDLKFNIGLSNLNKISYCKQYIINNNQCTWIDSTNNCQINTEQCTDYDASTQSDKRTFCLNKISSQSQCSWRDGDINNYCRDYQCQDIDNATSQNDCDKIKLGCNFYINTCFQLQNDCIKYYALGTDLNNKLLFCNGIYTITNQYCTFLRNDYTCKNRDLCTNYNVSTQVDKFNTCLGMYDINGNQCIYYKGNSCDMINNCESYIGFDLSNCPNLIDKNNRNCLVSTNSCRTFVCEDILNPINQQSCETTLPKLCQFTNNKCITISTCDTYIKLNWPTNVNPIQYCSTLKDKFNQYCTAVDNSSVICKQRECSDKLLLVNTECYDWKTTCKSDGSKCIESLQSCQQYTGNSDSCNKYLDSDNLNYCRVISGSDQQYGPCLELSCYQNTTATTDQQCQIYQNGCLTKGKGCIPNTAKCDEYRGTRNQCINFKGFLSFQNDIVISEICSGDYINTEISKCRSRICSDNLIDTTDALCQNFQTGCVTNGNGCIDINENCSSYKGTQQQCSQFKGKQQTIYCWNIDSATTSSYCINKECNFIKGTTDYECEQAFPKILLNGQLTLKCVSNGQQCINNPAKCSDFKGDDTQCGTFTALIDGPCKSNSNGYCTPRICYEAPQTYNTDELCQQYHSSCLTTGNGCIKYTHFGLDNLPTLSCSDITNKDVCSLKLGCTQINICLSQPSKCEQLTMQGQSICVNTVLDNGKKCIYDYTSNKCRDFLCNDIELVSDHLVCQQFSTNCTTNGNGCIIMQSCSKYINKLICSLAYSIDSINRCTWDNNICRQRKCSDYKGTTNSVCKTFSNGCISNGINCIGPYYECKDLLQKNCQSDYYGNPCIYYQTTCYKYEKCEDIPFITHQECQQFSNLCTSNGINCISITKCQKYTIQESCKIGIDGQCGWINNLCTPFRQCEDYQDNNSQNCQKFNINCISDGVKCVSINYCNTYQSQYLCESNKGLDGQCFWKDQQCKLKQCEDLTTNIDTYEKCKNQLLPIQCSSNGVKCITLQECSSYDEKSCIMGTDGECIYKIPIAQKNGQKQCRLKQCEDIKGSTLDVCKSILPNFECVTNGSTCIAKSKCNSYTTKSACNSGGLDGICVFKPDSSISTTGSCMLMTQCSDANNDREACIANSKYCQWTQSAAIKQCIPHSCSTYNNGQDCLPIPSLDQSKFTLCDKINNLCQEVSTSQLTQQNCYINSAKTYIWNNSQQKCVACKSKTTNTNPLGTITKNSTRIFITIICLIIIY